ncbi:hypothetical protein PABG_05215 [Paracoccidioides brasiliensis Pb03]|nr:hypothetical protein PABG_05215 [Paracoccidioides brasiliensis Pb03]
MASYGPTSARRMRVVFENDSNHPKVRNLPPSRERAGGDGLFFSVQKHTTIPIPRILGGQSVYVVGHERGRAEGDSQPAEVLFQAATQLITPKILAGLGHARGTAAYDHRLKNGTPCGPFDSVSQFLDFLVEPMSRSPKPSLAKTYRAKFSDVYGVNFAHADLSYEHILVDETWWQPE